MVRTVGRLEADDRVKVPQYKDSTVAQVPVVVSVPPVDQGPGDPPADQMQLDGLPKGCRARPSHDDTDNEQGDCCHAQETSRTMPQGLVVRNAASAATIMYRCSHLSQGFVSVLLAMRTRTL